MALPYFLDKVQIFSHDLTRTFSNWFLLAYPDSSSSDLPQAAAPLQPDEAIVISSDTHGHLLTPLSSFLSPLIPSLPSSFR